MAPAKAGLHDRHAYAQRSVPARTQQDEDCASHEGGPQPKRGQKENSPRERQTWKLMGLDRKSSMPASLQRRRSLSSTLAVIATISCKRRQPGTKQEGRSVQGRAGHQEKASLREMQRMHAGSATPMQTAVAATAIHIQTQEANTRTGPTAAWSLRWRLRMSFVASMPSISGICMSCIVKMAHRDEEDGE